MKPAPWPGDRSSLVAAVITFLGAAARLATLGAPSVWYDEAFHIFVSRLEPAQIITTAAADTLPPLSYLLLRGWMALVGQEESALRYLAAAWGVLTVPLTFVLGARLWPRPVALLGALLVAVGPFFLYWSRELRMYSQMTFLGLLLVVVFLRAWKYGEVWVWLTFGVVTALNLYTHSLGVLTLLALDAFALATAWRSPRRLLPLAGCHLFIGFLFLPWLLYLPGQVTRVLDRFWIAPPHPMQWLLSLADFLTGVDTLGDTLPLGEMLSVGAVVAVAVLLIPGAYALVRLARRQPEEREPLLLLGLLVAVPITTLYLLALVRSLYADRAMGVVAVALGLLVARAGVALFHRGRPLLLAWLPVLAVVPWYWWALAAYQGVAHLPHAAVSTYLQSQVQAGDAVLYNNKASYFPGVFYARFPEEYYLPHPPGSRWDDLSPQTRRALDFEETPVEVALASRARRFWLVLNGLDAAEDVTRLVRPLERAYGIAEETRWRGLWLFRFDRPEAAGISAR